MQHAVICDTVAQCKIESHGIAEACMSTEYANKRRRACISSFIYIYIYIYIQKTDLLLFGGEGTGKVVLCAADNHFMCGVLAYLI